MRQIKDPILVGIVLFGVACLCETMLLYNARVRLYQAEEKIEQLNMMIQHLEAYELSHKDVRKRLETLEGKVK